jgi:hypothetical protein
LVGFRQVATGRAVIIRFHHVLVEQICEYQHVIIVSVRDYTVEGEGGESQKNLRKDLQFDDTLDRSVLDLVTDLVDTLFF